MTKNIQQKTHNLGMYVKKYTLGVFLYILTYLLAGACTILQTIYFAQAIEQITLGAYKSAIITMVCIAGFIAIKRLNWYFSGLIYQKYANRMMADMNQDLATQAFKLNSKTYTDHDTGTFIQRIVQDPQTVINNLADMVDVITDIVSALIIIIYISTLNWMIGLALFAIIGICLLLENKRRKVKRKNKRDARKKNDKINSLTTEIVRSEKDIKSLGLEDKLSEISKQNYAAYQKANYKLEVTDMNFWATRNFIIEFIGVCILILGIYFIDIGLLTVASFMIIYSNNGNLYSLIWGIGDIGDMLVEIRVCAERMFSLFDNYEFVCETFGNVHLDHVKGEIEFKNVTYSYVEYEQNTNEENLEEKNHIFKKQPQKPRKITSTNTIFENLSFKIQPNTTVAFVGKSGSGKSTILNLISKMYEADNGEVCIDGININQLDKQTLRKSISLVNQFPYIFDMTIRENLLLAKKDATEEEIQDAINKASLREFVDSLHAGLNTKIGESGMKLSGGQKQRLAIARALLRDSSIIIFDESTSSLDNFAQGNIKKSIDELKGKSTIIIVAHRLSTIQNVDKIFFLDEGKIVDEGTFNELFANNEKFKAMFYAENISEHA